MQTPTIFSYAVFHIKNVLTVAVFAVKTAEKDHTASPKLAKKGGKKKSQKLFLGFVVVN